MRIGATWTALLMGIIDFKKASSGGARNGEPMPIAQRGVVLLAALALTLGAVSAEAGPITGSFSVAGDFLPVYGNTGATVLDANGVPTFESATGINFLNLDGTDPGSTGEFFVVNTFASAGGTNDFSALRWTTGTIRDFTFSGTGSAAYPNVPIVGFESFSLGDLTFDLESIRINYQDANTLSLSGTGFFNWTGYDRTVGSFEFTGTQSGGSIAFVASETAPAPVPEPASLFLMGSGAMLGFGRLRRRFR